MKNFSAIAIGISFFSLVISLPAKAQTTPPEAQTGDVEVLTDGGNFFWQFSGNENFATLKIDSTSRVFGNALFLTTIPFRQGKWLGNFQLDFEERFDDEVDIVTTITHQGSGSQNKTRGGKGLHAEGNSDSVFAFNFLSHDEGVDLFDEELNWRSSSPFSFGFDRDEIDEWNYKLEARHLNPGRYMIRSTSNNIFTFDVTDGRVNNGVLFDFVNNKIVATSVFSIPIFNQVFDFTPEILSTVFTGSRLSLASIENRPNLRLPEIAKILRDFEDSQDSGSSISLIQRSLKNSAGITVSTGTIASFQQTTSVPETTSLFSLLGFGFFSVGFLLKHKKSYLP